MNTESKDLHEVKLTQYSHGAGCGCKISPMVLDVILKGRVMQAGDKNLLVGNDSRDDAAVYDLGDGNAVISTTDFFMPIVDDPFDFGRIASANAISDVYAMGGKPLMAIAVLGWPLEKLSPEIATIVLDGSRSICNEAGIPLAGGHSIDSPEPIFGLAVTGIVEIKNLKRNDTAKAGNLLYLTKPLGVGILTTAQKNGLLLHDHRSIARDSMLKLNRIGADLSILEGVTAMTDITGFGLIGHLLEMTEGSGLQAVIDFDKLPLFPEIFEYIDQKCIPGGTLRNWKSYSTRIGELSEIHRTILCDPQTSGGLLIAVEPESETELINIFEKNKQFYKRIGKLNPDNDITSRIQVR